MDFFHIVGLAFLGLACAFFSFLGVLILLVVATIKRTKKRLEALLPTTTARRTPRRSGPGSTLALRKIEPMTDTTAQTAEVVNAGSAKLRTDSVRQHAQGKPGSSSRRGLAHTLRSMAKGWMGEGTTRIVGAIMLPRDMMAFHDITLPDGQGGTTQVDHVYIGTNGVFVIETKNFAGSIYGRANEPTWTQALGRTKNTFQNPIRQNYKHIVAVADACGIDRSTIHGMVVFTGRSRFPRGKPAGVFSPIGFPLHIRSTRKNTLTPDQVDKCALALQQNRLGPGIRTHLDHVAHLRAKHGK